MGTLPFKDVAQLVDGAGNVLDTAIRCSVWQLPSPRETPRGEVFDWRGEAESRLADYLEAPNRRLVVGGRKLTIVGWAPNTFIRHVQLQLRQMKQGG